MRAMVGASVFGLLPHPSLAAFGMPSTGELQGGREERGARQARHRLEIDAAMATGDLVPARRKLECAS